MTMGTNGLGHLQTPLEVLALPSLSLWEEVIFYRRERPRTGQAGMGSDEDVLIINPQGGVRGA